MATLVIKGSKEDALKAIEHLVGSYDANEFEFVEGILSEFPEQIVTGPDIYAKLYGSWYLRDCDKEAPYLNGTLLWYRVP